MGMYEVHIKNTLFTTWCSFLQLQSKVFMRLSFNHLCDVAFQG